MKTTIPAIFTLLSCFSVIASEFVGSQQCQSCHQQQFNAWQGSHHDKAMQHASKQSILANFNNVSFQSNNQTNRFYKKDTALTTEFWVNIKGPDGNFHDYQIKYTFGYTPLQQYMVEFDDGRVQLIPFAWDTRAKAEGGQRWFNLYPEMTENHQDFFWTNSGQNWNYMCADCHSTNVQKNFDVDENQYQTTFSEINVGCEACHGPASEHMAWTKNKNSKNSNINNNTSTTVGFTRDLSKQVAHWVKQTDKKTLMPKHIEPTQQNLVCAQCHSRHVQISNNDHVKSNEFGERYMLSLLDNDLYYPDGQVFDEDFVYGSFLQSKMHKNGVVCSDCHNPHSAQLILPKKTLCLQCHTAENYATKAHHHHQDDSTGAQCVNCHMPETTYMKIDNRRDHGWHIPRPDFALAFGTPDTCLSCHKDKDSQWSLAATKLWKPNSAIVANKDHFAPVFAATGFAGANPKFIASELSKIAQTKSYPAIVRASALDKMANIPDTNTLIAIARGVKSKDSLIRLGAINGAEQLPATERWRILSPLLTDKVLAVRAEAASTLVSLWQTLNLDQQKLLQPALSEYFKIQKFNQDRGFAHTNMGNILTQQGKYSAAEKAYQQSMIIEPYFATAYINMAELYRLQQKPVLAEKILLQGIKAAPNNSEIPYALGLAFIRTKNMAKASEYLAKATKLAPQNAHYYYVYGLSLEKSQPIQAYRALYKAYQVSQNPQHLYALCDMQVRHISLQAKQCIQQLTKVAPINVVEQLQKQYDELTSKNN